MSLHEIVDLSPTRYVERPVGGGPFLHATGAGWARLGMHHLDVHAIEGTDRYLVAYDGYGRRRLRVAFRRGSHTSSGPGLPGSAGRW